MGLLASLAKELRGLSKVRANADRVHFREELRVLAKGNGR